MDDEFLATLHPAIVGHLRPRGWSQEDAEDIASEAIERCLRMRKDHPGKTLAAGYLWTAVAHLAMDRYRHKRIVEKHQHEIERLWPEHCADDSGSGVVYREALELLGSYLKPRAVRALNLIVAGYDQESISRMTGMSMHSLKQVLRRARRSTRGRRELWREQGWTSSSRLAS